MDLKKKICSGLKHICATRIHFVLVHGAGHGGWCWYKVANLLESAGHTVTAVDLGASGSNPKQLSDIPTYSGYLQPLADVLEALPCGQKVALVGHSMGGVTISVAMEMFPSKIAIAIYCTAVMPTPDNFDLLQLNKQYFTNIPFFGDSKFIFDSCGAATAVYFGPNYLATTLYQLSPHEDLKCCLKLARYYPIYRDKTSRKETKLTSANYGSVNRAYIISDEDQAIPIATQLQYITKFPPKEVETISGSDHMPMFSKPQQLATYLQKIATKYVGCHLKVKK